MTARIENTLKNALDKELNKDEKLAWIGVPDASKLLSAQDIFMIPFSLLWGGFAVFWEVMVLIGVCSRPTFSIVSVIMPLWGIPFVLLGCYITFGRFFVKHKIKKNTIYGITNKRVIVLQRWPRNKVIAGDLTRIGKISKAGNDEIGDIVFGDYGGFRALSGTDMLPSYILKINASNVLGFFDLRRPREAYDIVSRAREIADKQSPS